jgi:polyisoprenoid-binding protein YceI
LATFTLGLNARHSFEFMSAGGSSSGRPRTSRALLLIAGGVLVVAAAAVAIVYFVIFPTSSPPKFALTGASSTAAAETKPRSGTELAGRWAIAAGSAAGYRVREKLAFLPAQSQAVGRTSSITGSVTFTGSNDSLLVSKAAFDIDVSTLQSDQSQRDEKIRVIGLESDTYPRATFTLAKPISLPAGAAGGKAVNVPATGALTIHGTTKTVTIPVAMRVGSAKVEAVGSITFPWSKFNMTAPSVGGFVTVTNSATMEFDLHLQRA